MLGFEVDFARAQEARPSDVRQRPEVQLRMKVKIPHSNQLSSQTITMFQKIRQLVKQHSIRKFVSFAMWRPINTEDVYPFMLGVRVSCAASKLVC